MFSSESILSFGTSVTDLTSHGDFRDEHQAINLHNSESEALDRLTDIKPAVNQINTDFPEIAAKHQDPGVLPLTAFAQLEDTGSRALEHPSHALGTRTEARTGEAQELFSKYGSTLEGTERIGPSQQSAERAKVKETVCSPREATVAFNDNRTTPRSLSDMKTAASVHEMHPEQSAAKLYEIPVAIQPKPQRNSRTLIVRSKFLNLFDSLLEKLLAQPLPPGHTRLRWTCVRPPRRCASETPKLIQNRRFANVLSKKMSGRGLRVLLKHGLNL